MLKTYFSNRSKWFHQVSAVSVVFLVAAIGTFLLISSHAATPYASLTASNGTLTNGASKQTCSGSANGSCVVFGGGSGGSTGAGGGDNNMIVGINPGTTIGDLSKTPGIKSIRYEADSNFGTISQWINGGYKVNVAFGYDVNDQENSGGVSAININNWTAYATNYYTTNCPKTSECPMVEVLNEPAGSWFWGNNADSQSNATAYSKLVQATYAAFHHIYGSSAPAILASYDGGYSGDTQWGQKWWSSSVSNSVDGVVMHPYGGSGGGLQSAQGSRDSITSAHNQTNKPVYVTEVGWPTAVDQSATGDSAQWPEDNSSGSGTGDQCDSVYNFMKWTRGTGYVNAVYYFNYQDYDVNAWYGVVDMNGRDKPSLSALGAAALNKPNPCPNPVSY